MKLPSRSLLSYHGRGVLYRLFFCANLCCGNLWLELGRCLFKLRLLLLPISQQWVRWGRLLECPESMVRTVKEQNGSSK